MCIKIQVKVCIFKIKVRYVPPARRLVFALQLRVPQCCVL